MRQLLGVARTWGRWASGSGWSKSVDETILSVTLLEHTIGVNLSRGVVWGSGTGPSSSLSDRAAFSGPWGDLRRQDGRTAAARMESACGGRQARPSACHGGGASQLKAR